MKSALPMIQQLLSFIDKHSFNALVEKNEAEKNTKKFSSWDHFMLMLFGQLSGASSLSDIVGPALSNDSRLNQLRLEGVPNKSTLAYANEKRPWELFRDAYYMVVEEVKRHLPALQDPKVFKYGFFAFDSSTISLCLSVFDWAKYRTQKGGIKLHLQLDLHSDLPVFADITDAKQADIHAARALELRKGAVIALDRGYVDYELFHKWTEHGVWFVTRTKTNMGIKVVKRLELPKPRGRPSQQDIELRDDILDDLKTLEFIKTLEPNTPDKALELLKSLEAIGMIDVKNFIPTLRDLEPFKAVEVLRILQALKAERDLKLQRAQKAKEKKAAKQAFPTDTKEHNTLQESLKTEEGSTTLEDQYEQETPDSWEVRESHEECDDLESIEILRPFGGEDNVETLESLPLKAKETRVSLQGSDALDPIEVIEDLEEQEALESFEKREEQDGQEIHDALDPIEVIEDLEEQEALASIEDPESLMDKKEANSTVKKRTRTRAKPRGPGLKTGNSKAHEDAKKKAKLKAKAEKSNRLKSEIPDFIVLKDEIINFSSKVGQAKCPDDMRRVTVLVLEKNRKKSMIMEFITNNMKLSPNTIAYIYHERWRIEIFFKLIKQELTVKSFYGTSPNAVKTQIFAALAAITLVKYLKYKSTTQTWTFSNLIHMLRLSFFTYHDLYEMITKPKMERPPPEPDDTPPAQNRLFIAMGMK
jgi:hypothetical protein